MKIKKFNLFLIIFALFWGILTAVVCFLLWNYLTVYEKSTPVYAGKQILELYKQGKYTEVMEQCGVKEDGMFTCEEYETYIKACFGSDFNSVRIYEGIQDKSGKRVLEMVGESNNPVKFFLNENPDALKYGLSSYSLTQCEIEKLTYSFTFPEYCSISVNGKTIDPDFCKRDVVEPYDVFETTKGLPFTRTCSLSGFVDEPEITVGELENDRYDIKADSGNYTVTVKPDVQKFDKVKETAVEYGIEYAKCMFNDSPFRNLGNIFMHDSSTYKRLNNYDRMWIQKHTDSKVENLRTDSIIQHDNGAYSAHVSFDYNVILRTKEPKSFPCDYTIYMMEVDGELKIASLEMS